MVQPIVGKHWLTGRTVRVTVEAGRIRSVEPINRQSDVWIAPGLIDVQLNGIGGWDLNAGDMTVDTVRQAVKTLHRGGVTRFCPTVVTGERNRMLHCIRTIAQACEADRTIVRTIIGIHVEGPFIAVEDGPRGAHNADWVRDPDEAELRDWVRESGGRICKVTLAPEKPGAIKLIHSLAGQGIVAAIGHTAATEAQIREAADAGATMSTHLGNGSHPFIKRHPNYIWAQLADDRLWAGFIPDGFHLPASTLKVMIRAKGSKAILTSDAVHLAGLPPGRYATRNFHDVILEPDGFLHLAHTPDILAGAATPLHVGLQFAARAGICTLAEAIRMATLHPAMLFGLDRDGVGTLDAGSHADFMLYRWGEDQVLDIVQTVLAGEVVFG